mmetsp:Transcript_3618/g.9705  ORF Transcript_3618/g.9705 Transcript_3618/m.9705 type:complete len:284 (-) Transcript_3618:772-1623(-)
MPQFLTLPVRPFLVKHRPGERLLHLDQITPDEFERPLRHGRQLLVHEFVEVAPLAVINSLLVDDAFKLANAPLARIGEGSGVHQPSPVTVEKAEGKSAAEIHPLLGAGQFRQFDPDGAVLLLRRTFLGRRRDRRPSARRRRRGDRLLAESGSGQRASQYLLVDVVMSLGVRRDDQGHRVFLAAVRTGAGVGAPSVLSRASPAGSVGKSPGNVQHVPRLQHDIHESLPDQTERKSGGSVPIAPSPLGGTVDAPHGKRRLDLRTVHPVPPPPGSLYHEQILPVRQ